MNGRSRTALAVLFALLAASALLPSALRVKADPAITDAGGGFKNATWDFTTAGQYARTNVLLTAGDASLAKTAEWRNYTSDAEFLAADNGTGTSRVVVNSGVRLAGSAANLIADGTFGQDPGPWNYTNGITGNVSAARDPAAKGKMWHDTPRTQFDSMDDGASSARWSGTGVGATCGILSDDPSHVEGIESVRCDYDNPGPPTNYAGAQRILGGADWSAYTHLAVWIDGSVAGLQAYLNLTDVANIRWDTNAPVLSSGWARYLFALAGPGDLTQVNIVQVRFTGMTGTAIVYLDDLVLFNYATFDETAKVSQTFTKPNATSGNPNAVVLTFDVEATPSINVLSYLNVSVAGVLEWTDPDVDVGPRSIYVDLSVNPALRIAGSFVIEFTLELVRTGTEEASMAAWIDNVALTATDYQSGSFTALAWSPGSAAIWNTATIQSNTSVATSVTVETRTGNTTTPGDATWSPWDATSGGSIGSPPNPYLQWRLLLSTANGSQTPVVTRLEIAFERYRSVGTVTTASFGPLDLIGWRRFFASDARPADTSVDYDVSGDGGPWVPVANGFDLSGLAANAIAVRATLSTANTSLTPSVAWLLIRYEYLGPLSLIVVAPDDVTMTADETQAYTATGYDGFGRVVAGIACSWSAGAGNLVPFPRTATYEPTIPGTWQIRCEVGSVVGVASVTVTAGVLATIVVLPDPGLVNVTESLDFTAEGRDADGNPVPLIATTWDPTIGQIASKTDTQATLEAPATEGTGTITARSGGRTGSASVVVLGLNAPRINGIVPDDSRPEDSPTWSLDLTTYAQNQVDADDTLNNLRWTITGLDGTIVTVFGTGVFGRHNLFFTPVRDAVGTDQVTLSLEDRGGARASQPLSFTLTQVNDPPRWVRPVDPIEVLYEENYTFNFQPYILDIDSQANEMSITTDEPTTRIRTYGLNAVFSYDASFADETLYVRVTVSDGPSSADTVVVVHVTGNPPPRLVGVPPDVDLDEDTTRTNALGAPLDTFVVDPGGEPLNFTAHAFTNLAVWVNDSGANVDVAGKRNFCGVDRITFRATDPQGAFGEVSVRVTVRCVNDAPVLAWTEDVHVRYSDTYRLDVTPFVSDVDNRLEDLTLNASDFPRTSVDRFTISFLYLWTGAPDVVPVLLTLSDGAAAASRAIAVRVSDNRPPELINPFDPLQFNEDERQADAIDLRFHFQDFEDGDALTYRITWSKVNATVSSGFVTLTPADHWFGQDLLVIRATDSGGAFAIETVVVEVLPVNDAPDFHKQIPAQDHLGGRPWVLDLRDYVWDVDDDLWELAFATDSPNVQAVGYLLLFEFPFADRTLDVTVGASDGRLADVAVMRVTVRGAGFWAAIYWPWSGFAVLALAAAAYVGYLRWTGGRYSFEDLFVVGVEGRLVMHTTRRLRPDRDEDLLAGMLTAIVMFVRDSFKEENEELKKFEFGERTVAVEKSDHVYGAAIFGGPVPAGVYLSLKYFLADMEDRYAGALQKWSGDVADLPGLKQMMEYFGRRGRYRVGDWKRFAT